MKRKEYSSDRQQIDEYIEKLLPVDIASNNQTSNTSAKQLKLDKDSVCRPWDQEVTFSNTTHVNFSQTKLHH
jgi:hypothetical protein